ncbi:hypothetical protein DRN84_01645 [Candidatus Geothermarchaeota archaeon]|nr:MAG: hypothetical protein DRN87_02295 [Candidatus Geothermarchaeota archaeon]RLG62535.1 MAG: hypothetical protein DRN84_01645 [Candidatus Geothermarchaeota archaeon]HEW94048.1 hypothetical protein [Thermoprotei archaeon]
MSRRTTIILDDDVYKMLVKESIERYGTAKAISRVINELLREKLSGREDIIQLLYSKKIAKVSWEEFEEFRRKLSKRFEES